MTDQPPYAEKEHPIRAKRRRLERLVAWGCLVPLVVALLLGGGWWAAHQGWLSLGAEAANATSPAPSPTSTLSPTPTPSLSPSRTPSPTLTSAAATLTPTPTPALGAVPRAPEPVRFPEGVLVLALREGLHVQIFAYQPQRIPLTRLTNDPWDHRDPALGPDGHRLAFAANPGGRWDLYLLDLFTGEVTPLTDDATYQGAPSWSPDALWLVYEAYVDGNLELFIRDVAGEQEPIRLTHHPAADYHPAWSPLGRLIAFVSTRAGTPQIFVANLDQPPDGRFLQVSRAGLGPADHPVWSPDGRYLAWGQTNAAGLHRIFVWDAFHPDQPPREVGPGDWPLFDPQGSVLIAGLTTPNHTYLTGFRWGSGRLTLPAVALPGSLHGLTLAPATLPWPWPGALQQAAEVTPTPLWTPALTPDPNLPQGRLAMAPLPNVEAPHPELSDAADEAFIALRQAVAQAVGWDALGRLEYAYMPLTESLLPDQAWLHTGRAFALSSAPLQAGWLVVVREDYGDQTYWRVYLRARTQKDTQGLPLHGVPWDFFARFHADPAAYEAGGAYAQAVPPGYWVDFTDLAAAYGWERLPAATDWRAYLPGARWSLFALRDGLSWEEAMRQIVPPEILLTPTPIPTPLLNIRIPTATPTPTESGP